MAGGSERRREVLGTGGYATVYAEWDPLLRRSVAVKELKGPFAENTPFVRAFRARAERLFDLEDEHVLAVYRIGDGQNAPAVVRELAPETLAALLSTSPLPVEKVADFLAQALLGLQSLHERGLVHGAVKPQNLFCFGDRVKVGDFGMPPASGLPWASSDRYTAPEVLRGEAASPASDLYSLGLVTYELLLGPAGFEELTGRDLPPLLELLKEIPVPVSQTLQQMTRRELADRTPDARRALALLRDGVTTEGRSGTNPSLDDTRAFDARLRSRVATTERRGQILKWAAALAFVLVLATLAFAANRFLEEQRPGGHRGPAQRAAVPPPPVAPAVAPATAPAAPPPQISQPEASPTPPTPSRAPEPNLQAPTPKKAHFKPPETGASPPTPVVTEPKPAVAVNPAMANEPTPEPARQALPESPPIPADEMESVVMALEKKSKAAQEAYADEEKPNEELAARLEEFYDAATGVRKAWRKASGRGFGAFRDKLLRRASPEADRQAFEAQAKDLVRRGSQIDGLLEKVSMGSAAMGAWREVQRNLRRLEASFR